MMSLSDTRYLQMKAATLAAEERLEPIVLTADDLDDLPPFPFPNLGHYLPQGWEPAPLPQALVDRYGYAVHSSGVEPGGVNDLLFVDASGMGSDKDPALSVSQLLDVLTQCMAYGGPMAWGIYNAGAFQVHLRAFRRAA